MKGVKKLSLLGDSSTIQSSDFEQAANSDIGMSDEMFSALG